MRMLFGAAAAASLAGSPAAAQLIPSGSDAPIGQRVSITATAVAPQPIVGRLVASDSGRLSAVGTRNGTAVNIPLEWVDRMHVSGGHDRGASARKGMWWGLGIGTALFALSYHDVAKDDYWGIAVPMVAVMSIGLGSGIG